MDKVFLATEDDIIRLYGAPIHFLKRWVGYAYKRNGAVLCIGGVAESEDNVWFGFIENPRGIRFKTMYRYALKLSQYAREMGAVSLKTWCQDDIPRAEEFMKRLGFVKTDEFFEDKVLWSWDLSRHS